MMIFKYASKKDLKAAIELIAKETGAQKVHMFGESSGAIRAGAYAQVHPERIDRLALGAFTYKGENSPTLTERAKGLLMQARYGLALMTASLHLLGSLALTVLGLKTVALFLRQLPAA